MINEWRWWHVLVFVLMVVVYGLVGTDDLEQMERLEAKREARYASNW